MVPDRIQHIVRSLFWVLDTNKNGYIDLHRLFNVSFFYDEENEYKYFVYKTVNRNDMYFIDQKFNIFNSLEELLSYNFGSTNNYIETYKYRLSWRRPNTSK
jgi:hypothetical protein